MSTKRQRFKDIYRQVRQGVGFSDDETIQADLPIVDAAFYARCATDRPKAYCVNGEWRSCVGFSTPLDAMNKRMRMGANFNGYRVF